MTKDGGRRIAIAGGAMLADPASLGKLLESAGEGVFEPAFWAARGALTNAGAGRGSAWFVTSTAPARGPAPAQGSTTAPARTPAPAPAPDWVLRHCRRGGFIARVSRDRYLWAGENRVRAFVEWRLLDHLARLGLPVPIPIAARYQRRGCTYRCDLITRRIPHARPLSEVLADAPLDEASWRAIGAAIARLHRAGVDHADLNAHNILYDSASGGGSDGGSTGGSVSGVSVSVIDFDRGCVRRPGAWTLRNLQRLRRSLTKISRALPPGRVSNEQWDFLLAGYRRA